LEERQKRQDYDVCVTLIILILYHWCTIFILLWSYLISNL
jgi:uncharacterized membrane protein (DUF485 family)